MEVQHTTFDQNGHQVVWTHLTSPGREDLLNTLKPLQISLPLDASAATHAEFGRYPDFVHIRFFLLHPETLDDDRSVSSAVNFVITDSALLSWSASSDVASDFRVAAKKLNMHPGLVRSSNHLAFYVIDDLLEQTFPFFDRFNEKVADIEHETLHGSDDTKIKEEIFHLKRIVMRVRRLLGSERDVAYQLARYWSGEPTMDTVYAFELYDHVIRLTDNAETYREMMDTVMDVYLSSVSNRLNEIVKTLTIVTALFMPASVIAALYGMNFEHIPGAGSPLGFHLVILAVLLISATLLWIFKRRKWI
jgi:magnesium transporter